jgi:hypothetical protein
MESNLAALRLKPCPFCGEPAMLQSVATYPPAFRAGCVECDCVLETYNEVEVEAVLTWNRRSSAAMPDLAFQLFWAWTNHPSEAFARKSWESSDAMSRASWERCARRGMNYLQGVADEA